MSSSIDPFILSARASIDIPIVFCFYICFFVFNENKKKYPTTTATQMEDLEATSGMDDFEQLNSENNGINTTELSNCQSTDNNNNGTMSIEKSSSLNLKGAVQLPIKNKKKEENILRDFIVWYLELLNKFPISTKVCFFLMLNVKENGT